MAFSPLTTVLSFSTPEPISETAVGDFNGDGHLDLIAGPLTIPQDQDAPIKLFFGDGKGHFTDATSTIIGGAPGVVHPREMVTGDFNGDGVTDLFIADFGWDHAPFPGHRNILLLSDGQGHLVNAAANLPNIVDGTHSATAADIDGDGDIDIYVGNLYSQPFVAPYFLINDGHGVFARSDLNVPAPYDDLNQRKYVTDELADVDGDGDRDLILGGDVGVASVILRNNGHGVFGNPIELPAKPFGINSIALDADTADLNADGRLDILITYTNGDPFYVGRYVQVLMQNAAGAFFDETASRLPQSVNSLPWQLWTDLSDVDGDGDLDLFAHYLTADGFALFINDGAGHFTLGADKLSWWVYDFGDFNEDGLPDLINVTYPLNGQAALQIAINLLSPPWIVGTDGADELLGRPGPDVIHGRGGDDILSGLDGDDVIDGDAGNDTLLGGAGDDRLDGGAGVDSMAGGSGDDIYIVDDFGDSVLEAPFGGFDTERSSISRTIDANVEVLVLTGAENLDARGDEMRNVLAGNDGNNVLDGARGCDSMAGGKGDDSYYIDSTLDLALEAFNEGADTILSLVSAVLPLNVEKLTLLDNAGNIEGIGNAAANTINGNNSANVLDGAGGDDILNGQAGDDVLLGGAGNDRLDGGPGGDVLIGGAGSDRFVFATAIASGVYVDQIVDFVHGQDTLELSLSVYAALGGPGQLDASAFVSEPSARAHNADQHIIHNPVSGMVYYDPDGSGAAPMLAFARVEAGHALVASDFEIAA